MSSFARIQQSLIAGEVFGGRGQCQREVGHCVWFVLVVVLVLVIGFSGEFEDEDENEKEEDGGLIEHLIGIWVVILFYYGAIFCTRFIAASA